MKRWIVLAAVFTFLSGAIIASGCQPSNTVSTNAMLTSNQDSATNCTICSNCSVAGQTYNCNDNDERNAYLTACTANCEYNGKTYDCTTPLGFTSFWSAFGCDMCMQACEGADSENSNTND